jgi:acyl-CoA thioester hydrolase
MAAKPYIVEEYVRWSDVDFAGIIFHGAYLRFFELAETELFRAAGLAYRDMTGRYDVWLPRASVHSEFYRPARLDDRLRVAAYLGRVGAKSLTLNFDVQWGGVPELGAAGYQVLVCVDRATFRAQPLPGPVVTALEPYTLTTEAARALLGVAPR